MSTPTTPDYQAGWRDCAQVIEFTLEMAIKNKATIDEMRAVVLKTGNNPPKFTR